MLKVGIPREIHEGEFRVAVTPRTTHRLRNLGFDVYVESGAGIRSEFSDEMYRAEAANIVKDVASLWASCDLMLKVHGPAMHPDLGIHEADLIKEGAALVSFIWPAQHHDVLERLAARNVTTLAMDCVPRISRAQHVDALSAMGNLAGFRAVVEAVAAYPRVISGQITAAGKLNPAKVLIIGGGVAGLSAIGAARGMGAIVRAFDTRLEVREQVESMGAEFLELDFKEDGAGDGGYGKVMSKAFIDAEMALFAKQAMEVDIIISTALIPGKPAPKLITAGMVESMREGSVIVDLAALQGGNCALTRPGEIYTHQGVRIIGFTDLTSRMAIQASWLYSSTVVNLVEDLGGAKEFHIDMEDELVRGALVTHEGAITWPPPKREPPSASEEAPPSPEPEPSMDVMPEVEIAPSYRNVGKIAASLAALVLLLVVGWLAPVSFLNHLTVFVLSCLVGWQVVWSVTPALHTPLMSVTNAISGIIIIGGMLHLAVEELNSASILGALAVFLATINITGGFLVTRRMLSMFTRG